MHHWNWHIAPSENPYEFELFPKTYKNFTVLSCEQISEEEFNIVTKTLSFEEFSVSSVTEFIKDYGRILGFTYTLTPLPLLSNGHLQVPKRIEREIKPLYFIPPHLRTDKERIEINLADINLPHKERQTIIVQMRSLEEINQKIKISGVQKYIKSKKFRDLLYQSNSY
ncbi:MAG: hypothetical protein HWD61_04755 [Parachlamydiaceae bacterium]|nr:MAG: hypothetical protein HWD61_04755 [Parachlamydiaceae bacterium]